jgi:G3E family GTPase
VVARQLESANAVILSDDDETARALVQAINPQVLIRTTPAGLLGVRRQVQDATEPGSIVAPLENDGLVRTLIWQSDRPFHPGRLFDALEDVVAGTARGRGTIWTATQHRNRLSWDSFGTNVAIGVLGPWLADLPTDRWSSVGQQHQARSALEWNADHGDRASYLSFTGVGLDVRELQERLDGCLLRADEAVHALTDPFAPYLEGSTAA